MASSISICSNALLALGAHPINSFDENTEHARLCSNIYPTVRNDLLRKHHGIARLNAWCFHPAVRRRRLVSAFNSRYLVT